MTQSLERISSGIQKIDDIFRTSPTAQALTAHAPAILQHFKELNAVSLQHKQQMEILFANQQQDLKKFRDKLPLMISEIRTASDEIRMLQRTVREYAAAVDYDPRAQTVIEYTNQQILQQINIFNSLILNFMNL